jgi:hypothetical protein
LCDDQFTTANERLDDLITRAWRGRGGARIQMAEIDTAIDILRKWNLTHAGHSMHKILLKANPAGTSVLSVRNGDREKLP